MKQLNIVIAAAVVFGLYTWWIYGLGAASITAKTEVATVAETGRQSGAAGELAVGDVKHEQQVKEAVNESKQTRAPQDCDLSDIGDLRYDALRVRNEIRGRSNRASVDRTDP